MDRNINRQFYYQIGGASGIGPIYRRGKHVQVGRGLGGALQSIWRFLSPYLASSLKSISGEAVRSGAEILSNLESAPLKTLLAEQRDKSIRNLSKQVGKKLMSLNQAGQGILPYKRIRSLSNSLSPKPKRRRTASVNRKTTKRKVVKRKIVKKKRKVAKRKPSKRKPAKRSRTGKSGKKVKFHANFLDKFLN